MGHSDLSACSMGQNSPLSSSRHNTKMLARQPLQMRRCRMGQLPSGQWGDLIQPIEVSLQQQTCFSLTLASLSYTLSLAVQPAHAADERNRRDFSGFDVHLAVAVVYQSSSA